MIWKTIIVYDLKVLYFILMDKTTMLNIYANSQIDIERAK